MYFMNTVLTINDLKRELKLADTQLDTAIEESDLIHLAECFDDTEVYVPLFALSRAQRTDVKDERYKNGVQAGMTKALKFWTNQTPQSPTFRALLEITLSLSKGEVAVDLAKYLVDKCECCTMCIQ